jgi:hypothetical protein
MSASHNEDPQIFRPGNDRANLRKLRRDPAEFILVLVRELSERNRDERIPWSFDEFGAGKVSFPAQVSVK